MIRKKQKEIEMKEEKLPVGKLSWIHHPVHGVHSMEGFMNHVKLSREKPDLGKLETTTESKENFEPPRGYGSIRHDRKEINLDSYPGHDPKYVADAKEVDKHVREKYKLPKTYKTILHKHFGENSHWKNDEKFKKENIY